ncbi:hypothetical protein D5018_16775 [Parashewanella curva]|uniref:Uncharacterized protein n=2 Tax=Parashewanella curva TaxID=2338552 RepID=A0A3L8PSZ1_9GAMM|nr:hypothetical protein D5018_16775 [Parashewanella curva]
MNAGSTMSRRVWPFLINGITETGGIVAFFVAFGWLLLPSAQQLTQWQMNIEQWTFALESTNLLGLSPWILFAAMVLAFSVVVFILSGLTFLQSLAVVSITFAIVALGYAYSPIGLGVVLLLVVGIALCCLQR